MTVNQITVRIYRIELTFHANNRKYEQPVNLLVHTSKKPQRTVALVPFFFCSFHATGLFSLSIDSVSLANDVAQYPFVIYSFS